MRKILVVEDEDAIREVVALNLRLAGYEVTEAASAEQALAVFSPSAGFDVAVLDIMLPGMNGFSLCETIRRDSASIGIIMLSAKTLETDKIKGLSIGADDYMTKPFSLMVLVSKVHAFMRRLGSDGALIRSGEISVNYSEMKAYKNKEPVSLSKKELQLLLFLLENAGQIVSKEQILEKVWDLDGQFVDENTVPVNISRLKSKIGNDYIRNVRGLGYIWTEESLKE